MKGIVYLLRQCPVDAPDHRQIFNPGPGNFLQATQLLQQLLAALRAHAGYLFKRRSIPGFCAPCTVPGDRKTVRLVPHLLYQVERR